MTRNIQDIAPLLADHFVDFESDVKTLEENNKLVADNAQRLGLYHKYLGLLHDRSNIKTNNTTVRYSTTLHEFTTHVFSNVIVDKKKIKIDHHNLVFPIRIDFETTNLTFNKVDEN